MSVNTPLEDILKDESSDKEVKSVRGKVVGKVDNYTFALADGTGRVHVSLINRTRALLAQFVVGAMLRLFNVQSTKGSLYLTSKSRVLDLKNPSEEIKKLECEKEDFFDFMTLVGRKHDDAVTDYPILAFVFYVGSILPRGKGKLQKILLSDGKRKTYISLWGHAIKEYGKFFKENENKWIVIRQYTIEEYPENCLNINIPSNWGVVQTIDQNDDKIFGGLDEFPKAHLKELNESNGVKITGKILYFLEDSERIWKMCKGCKKTIRKDPVSKTSECTQPQCFHQGKDLANRYAIPLVFEDEETNEDVELIAFDQQLTKFEHSDGKDTRGGAEERFGQMMGKKLTITFKPQIKKDQDGEEDEEKIIQAIKIVTE